jgi:excisionase family DNA binding protein
LSRRQFEVLRWIADGCPEGAWPDQSHKISARALESRHLAHIRRKGKVWHAVLSDDGQYYLEHGRYPEPPPAPQAEPGHSLTASRPTATEALVSARRAIRRASADQERRSLRAAHARASKQAVRPSLLKDIPMRYKIVVSRVQTAERHVRAVSEEDAIRKVQEELERPYGFLNGWTTVGTDMDIVAIESPLGDGVPAQINQDGSFLLSVKAAAKHLGISAGMLYELINRGEIAHVMIGSRRYISRDQMSAFIESNTHTGYQMR